MKKIKILYTLYMLPGGLQVGGSYSFSQLLKKSKKTKKKKKMRKPRHKKTKHAYKKGMLMKHKEGLMKYKKNKWIKI